MTQVLGYPDELPHRRPGKHHLPGWAYESTTLLRPVSVDFVAALNRSFTTDLSTVQRVYAWMVEHGWGARRGS